MKKVLVSILFAVIVFPALLSVSFKDLIVQVKDDAIEHEDYRDCDDRKYRYSDIALIWLDHEDLISRARFDVFETKCKKHFMNATSVMHLDLDQVNKVNEVFGVRNFLISLLNLRVESSHYCEGIGTNNFFYVIKSIKKFYPDAIVVWSASPDAPRLLPRLIKFYTRCGGILLAKDEKKALFGFDLKKFDPDTCGLDTTELDKVLLKYS